jgi:transposase
VVAAFIVTAAASRNRLPMTMKRIYSNARITALRTPAVLSQSISHLDNLPRGTKVVLYGRVSSDQRQKDNLPELMTNLQWEAERRGHRAVGAFQEIIPGWRKWRLEFERAVIAAKDADAVIVTESVTRFRRSWVPNWQKRRRQFPLSVFDIMQLMQEADGVKLVTVVHPDATPGEVKSYESKRGQGGKGNCGGRPVERFPKKARRVVKKPKAILMRKQGYSVREIAHKLKIPPSTVQYWTKKLHT